MYLVPVQPSRGQACGAVFAVFLVAFAVLAFVVACGSEAGGEATFEKVTPSDQIYTLDDLLAIGFRKSIEYDVEGLPEATGAWYGFWGPDPYSRKEYEVRFYASHEDAVEHGTAPADEVTGTDTLRANKDNLTWEAGKSEWWIRRWTGTTEDHGGQAAARHADFAIFGNIVMLCEGRDSSQSLERCEGLVKAIREGRGE